MKVAVFGCLLLCGLLAGVVVAEWPALPDCPAPLSFPIAPPLLPEPAPPPRRTERIPTIPLWALDPPVKDKPEWDDCPQLSTWTDPRVCRAWI